MGKRAPRPSRALDQIFYAVGMADTAVSIYLVCKRCGCRRRKNVGVLAQKFVRWWSRENGGVAMFCPKCDGRRD